MGHQRHITIDAKKYKWCICMEGGIDPLNDARKVPYIPFMVHGGCTIAGSFMVHEGSIRK